MKNNHTDIFHKQPQDEDFQFVARELESLGWKYTEAASIESHDFNWYKRFPDVKTRCFCNNSNQGIILHIKGYDFRKYPDGQLSFQLHLVAETFDGVWVDLMAYAIQTDKLFEVLDSQCGKLIRAWEACNSNQTGEVSHGNNIRPEN